MFGLLLGNQTPKFYHKPSNRAITNPTAMDRKMAGTVSLERNAPTSPAITRKDPALPHRPGLKSYAMRLRRRYKTGLFYERTYPLPFHFYERFSTPDLLCGQRRPLQNPSPASGRDKRGPPVSSQNRKDSPILGRAALVAAGRGVGGRAGTRPSRIFAKPQPSLRPRQARPSRIFAKPQRFAGLLEHDPPVSSQNRKDSPVFGRAALVAAERGVGGRAGARPSRGG